MTPRRFGLGRAEITKDTIQVLAESTATHAGTIATILSSAIRDVAHELGDFASDVFEMRDAASRASQGAREDDVTPAP